MLAPLPKLDKRQASNIHKELDAIASVLLPEWRGTEFDGDFGQALLIILSRLGEHVATRIDQTPRRDALAFFNMLDVPVQAAQPSSAPLIFQLGEKRDSSVFAPSRIQVGASTAEGQLLFETTDAVNLTPARLDFLAAVDGERDSIELAPPGFLELTPPKGPLPTFEAITFSAQGSKSIQIEPFEALEKGDYIRIGSSVYRLNEGQDGLFSLLDPLDDDVDPGMTIEKVDRFDVLHHRNVQEHALYIAHSELFNLSQPSTISLDIEPASAASELGNISVQWAIYGKAENQDKADWQAVKVQPGGTAGKIAIETERLEGTEETEINAIKSRWLRARFTAESLAIVRIKGISIGIESGIEEEPLLATAANDSQAPAKPPVTTSITQAFHNNHPISLSSEFLPFGPEPLRFDTFSIAAPEAFSKKGANVTLTVSIAPLEPNLGSSISRADVPTGKVNANEPQLAWEYFDGEGWRSLPLLEDETNHFLQTREGDIIFKVPDDLEIGEVAGQEDYWIRARLAGGDYGRPTYTIEATGILEGDPFGYVIKVDTSSIHPPLITSIEVTFDATEPSPAEHVLVENNLDFRNNTQASQEENASFELFEGAKKLNDYLDPLRRETEASQRVLYLGFNKPFDVRPLSVFVDAEDQEEKVDLDFEVLGSDDWRKVNAIDETNGFHRRGFVQIFVDVKPRLARLFAKESYWLRIRPHGLLDGNWAPRLWGIFVNAVRSEQAKTIKHETLGSSAGEPGLRVQLSDQPVLQDSLELRITESLSDEERKNLVADTQNRREHEQAIRNFEELSLEGDWVLWRRVDSFVGKGPDDRVYRLDTGSGEIEFGNNRQGRIPPAGNNNIRAIRYQTGGGIKGNVAAYTITGLKSGVEGVELVVNPIQAAGGTDAPAVEEQVAGAPARLRSVGRALSPPDIEALVVSTSPDLIRARCVFPKSPGDSIRVAVLMRNGDRCPMPTLAERDGLAEFIRSKSWGGWKRGDIKVTGPEYISVRIKLRLRANSNEKIAELEQAATDRLRLLLHPVDGGPSGNGWPFGRRIWESDILRALAELPSFDTVLEFSPRPEDLDSPPTLGMICAEEGDIEVIVEPVAEV